MNKVASLILILSSSLYAQSKVGSSAAAFLGSGVGSRAIGMGGAFSAVGGDASILYWNPGAMANIKKSEVLLSKANWLVESDLNYIASIIKLEKGRSFGGYLMQLDYGREEITDLNNQDIKYNQTNFEQGGIIVASSNQVNHKKLCNYLKDIIRVNDLYPLDYF